MNAIINFAFYCLFGVRWNLLRECPKEYTQFKHTMFWSSIVAIGISCLARMNNIHINTCAVIGVVVFEIYMWTTCRYKYNDGWGLLMKLCTTICVLYFIEDRFHFIEDRFHFIAKFVISTESNNDANTIICVVEALFLFFISFWCCFYPKRISAENGPYQKAVEHSKQNKSNNIAKENIIYRQIEEEKTAMLLRVESQVNKYIENELLKIQMKNASTILSKYEKETHDEIVKNGTESYIKASGQWNKISSTNKEFEKHISDLLNNERKKFAEAIINYWGTETLNEIKKDPSSFIKE